MAVVDEMRACLAAGCHPNLIDTIGRLAEGKMQQEGIILELISPSYTILGQPPSLESCSRDCYAPGLTFEFDWSLSILIGIASAASHLHHLGIIHGGKCLYPPMHEVLINQIFMLTTFWSTRPVMHSWEISGQPQYILQITCKIK